MLIFDLFINIGAEFRIKSFNILYKQRKIILLINEITDRS